VSSLRHTLSRLSRAPLPRVSSGWLRALKAVGWLLAGLELVYLIGANVFLNCNLLPLAFTGTNQVKATVASGWSIIPERVHVRKVRFTFQDHNLEFAIEVDRAFLVVHLSELLHHTFHGSHLRGEGLSFRMRHRVDPWSKNEPAVGAFAPIPEFIAPAVFEAYVPEAPIPDAKYDLWAIHLDDVDVGVKEAWVQAFRYLGHGRARGQFRLKPARNLWVGPASLDLEPGLLSAGAYRVARGLHGHIECTVHPFDVRVPQGMAVFRYISAHIQMDSPDLDPQVYALFAGETGPQVSSAGGSLHLDVETSHGVFSAQSNIDIHQHGFQLRAPELELDADHVELQAGMEGTSASQATLLVDHGIIREPIALGYPPRIEHVSATVVSDNRDVARDFGFKEARLGEARLLLGDSRWFNRWLKGKGFELAGGGASVLARGRYADSVIDAEAMLETEGLAATIGSQHVRYSGSVMVAVAHVDPKRMTGSAMTDITGRSLRAELGKGELDLAGLRAHVTAEREEHGAALHGQAWLSKLSSSAPGLTLLAPEVNAVADSEERADGSQLTHFSAVVPALIAEGHDARLTTAATARGTLAQSKNRPEKRLDFEATLLKPLARFGTQPVKTAATSSVNIHGALSSDAAGALSGKLSLLPAAWRVDAANMRFSGKSALDLELATLDLAKHSGVVEAKLSSTGVTVGDTTQNANCAWSRVQTLDLDATAKLLARGTTDFSLKGELAQTELSWGDFTTRADIGVAAHFDQSLLARNGAGSVDVSLRNAAIQSGGGGKTGWSALAPSLDIAAELSKKDGKILASAKVSSEHAQGRIGATRLSTDLQASFKIDALDLDARTAHGSGAVHLRNVALPNAAEPVSKWWADVKVDSIYGHAEQNLELGGTFRAELRDATPGLAVLASEGSLPKWVESAFPLRGLTVTGSMARRCRLTDIHLVELSGGPAVARGRLQSVPDGFQGALLLRLAGFQAISAGLDFDADHTHFGLFDGDSWLARFDQSFDRKSNDAVKLACPVETNKCSDTTQSSTAALSSMSPTEQASRMQE
jgi:hypothetical protein